ncbi:MAG: hypothetical protein A2Z95_01435 [Gallionellales bacterium GWA2_60_18]|nr:MAG: hypothetical protein A2Z95_01435 [Gallionellales bacterium GWA2_60_18]
MKEKLAQLSQQLYVKLAWRTLLIGLLIGLLAAVYETTSRYKAVAEGRDGEFSYLLNASFQPASRASYLQDESLAGEVAHGLLGVPAVYQVIILDRQGRELISVSREKFQPGLLARLLFTSEQQYRLPLVVPDDLAAMPGAAGAEESRGELFVALDREVIAQQYWRHFLRTLADESLGGLMVALLLSLVYYYWVTRPLGRISAVLRKARPENIGETRLEMPPRHESDEIGLIVGTLNRLIADLQHSEELRRADEEQLRLLASIFEHSHDAIVIADAEANLETVNPAFTEITGYAADEVVGKNPRLLQSGRQSQEFYEGMWKALLEKGFWTGEVWNRRKDGSFYSGWLSISVQRNEQGQIEHFIGVTSDNTVYKAAQERIKQMAYYDQLTGLPNRSLLQDRADRLLAQVRREEKPFALMFIDLDNFKRVNDSLGHPVGDLLLQEVARRLVECVREVDTVSRQGGDEFVVLLPDTDSDGARHVAEKILASLSEPHHLEGHEVVATPSIGISLFPRDAQDFEDLTKHADTALYRVKEQGRAGFQFFTNEMNVIVHERQVMEDALRQAVADRKFTLHYQPQIDLSRGSIVGMEALIRWNDPELGDVEPDTFIPLAEEVGLIVQIGTWVLHEACAQNRQWQDMGLPCLPVAVNVSALQIHQADFVQVVADALDKAGLEAKYLELELTERAVMEFAEQTVQTMQQLNALGVGLSVDDFGTSYSSLTYLRRFPLKKLKIDKSFVHDLPVNADDRTISNSIILLAHGLNAAVVAEGVEDERQLEILRGQGSDAAQGFHFSKPLPPEEFAALLRAAKAK